MSIVFYCATLSINIQQEFLTDHNYTLPSRKELKRRLEESVKDKELLLELVSKLNKKFEISCQQSKTLADIGAEIPNDIFQRLVKRKHLVKAPYPESLKKFASTLHFYSPKAYRYFLSPMNN